METCSTINIATLHLSLLADQNNGHPNLHGVCIKDDMAYATDGHMLGMVPETGGYSGFLPTEACTAVLKGAKKDATFVVEGPYLSRNDGVSFKIIETCNRGDFPDVGGILRESSNFEINESIALNLTLLSRIETFLRRSYGEVCVEFNFDCHMSAVKLTSGDFVGYIMPIRK